MSQSHPELGDVLQPHESLWELVRSRGMERRRFLQLMMAGGTSAVLAACGIGTSPGGPTKVASEQTDATQALTSPWFKDPTPFIQREDKGLEARLEDMQGMITPNRLFFVRNNSSSVSLDTADWRLAVEGDAVDDPLELTYENIMGLPSRTLISYLECAGNHRAMLVPEGQGSSGTQWMTGANWQRRMCRVALRRCGCLAGIHEAPVSVLLLAWTRNRPRRVSGSSCRGKRRCSRHPAGLRAERGNTAQGPWFPAARPRSRLGGKR